MRLSLPPLRDEGERPKYFRLRSPKAHMSLASTHLACGQKDPKLVCGRNSPWTMTSSLTSRIVGSLTEWKCCILAMPNSSEFYLFIYFCMIFVWLGFLYG